MLVIQSEGNKLRLKILNKLSNECKPDNLDENVKEVSLKKLSAKIDMILEEKLKVEL